jgi:hypothetical protein
MNLGDLVTGGIGGAIGSSVVGAIFWWLFRRPMEAMEHELHDQRQEIATLRDQRIAKLEEKSDEAMTRGACLAAHAMLEKRLDQGTADFRDIRDDIGIIRASVERLSGSLDLILKNMGLHMLHNPRGGAEGS